MSAELHPLTGQRSVIDFASESFPRALREIPVPPERLYCVGNPAALEEGLAVVGARNATPYGIGCAQRFSKMASLRGVAIISGGARGCDSAAHKSALEAQGQTVVFMGGGSDYVYPARNHRLFQQIIDAGGAVVSEHEWSQPPMPYMFRARNRLIAGLARATLIVEAGMPSGTFSTADEALSAGKEVWAVPGAITSEKSAGANHLIAQGATPIIDDNAFLEALFQVFGCMRSDDDKGKETAQLPDLSRLDDRVRPLIEAMAAQPMSLEEIHILAAQRLAGMGNEDRRKLVMTGLAQAETMGVLTRYPNGKLGMGVPQAR
ncbi:MAG: DNA-processing protein DprA [Eggerthellaceae bacterium]|nr:DNA-processing protein DprA [Eggerthellaceae bacterium]